MNIDKDRAMDLNGFKKSILDLRGDVDRYIESEIGKSDNEYTIYGIINTTNTGNSKYLNIKSQLDAVFKQKDVLSRLLQTSNSVEGDPLSKKDLEF